MTNATGSHAASVEMAVGPEVDSEPEADRRAARSSKDEDSRRAYELSGLHLRCVYRAIHRRRSASLAGYGSGASGSER